MEQILSPILPRLLNRYLCFQPNGVDSQWRVRVFMHSFSFGATHLLWSSLSFGANCHLVPPTFCGVRDLCLGQSGRWPAHSAIRTGELVSAWAKRWVAPIVG
jgi:hypothetical protein